MGIKIVLVDDHQVLREGLRVLLDQQPDNLQGMVALGWVRHKIAVDHIKISAQLREKIKGQWIGFFSRISLAWHNFRASWHSSRAVAIRSR